MCLAAMEYRYGTVWSFGGSCWGEVWIEETHTRITSWKSFLFGGEGLCKIYF